MNWGASAISFLAAGGPISVRSLIYFQPKQFGTTILEPFGFWTGGDHRTFVVNGESRLYYGAQGQLAIPATVEEGGTTIQNFSPSMLIPPEAETMARGYDLTNCPVEVHCALFNPVGNALVEIASQFKGYIDTYLITSGAEGNPSRIDFDIKSSARRGTKSSSAHKSHQSHKLRDANDEFRKYSDLGNAMADTWAYAD